MDEYINPIVFPSELVICLFLFCFVFLGGLVCWNDGRNSVLAQLGPLMCWCRLLCWDSVIEAQFIGGHQSLCSLCKTAEKLLTTSYPRLSHFRTDVEFLPHDEKYERIILSHQSADTVALHKYELIILHLLLNEKTWRKKICLREKLLTCYNQV